MIKFKHKDKYEQILKLINSSDKICIISHRNPDGDTLGSALGLRFALEKYGKNIDNFCHDIPDGKLRALPGVELIKNNEVKEKYDLAIAVDSASIDRLGNYMNIFERAKNNCQFDHHISNDSYASGINIIEESGANCENIAMFLLYLKEIKNIDLFNEKTVDCLYTGLVTDTGSFAFTSVTAQTMYIAYLLKEMGANSAKIVEHYMRTIEYNVFKLKQRVMSNAKFYFNKKLTISVLTKKDFDETDTKISLTDGLIQNILNISDVEVAILIAEASQNSYKISIRTKNIDAVHIAYELGNGGGHPRASGCRVNNIIEEVLDKAIRIVEEML